MKYTINLTGEHSVTKGPRDKSWSAAVAVDLESLSADMVAKLALHGLHQKVADAASGATNAAEAEASMSKARDAILAGEWSSRVAGGGVDEETAVQRMIARTVLKGKFGAKSPEWAKFTGLDDAAQMAKLDEIFANNRAALQSAVEEKLAERKRERERKAGLVGAVTIDI